MIKLYSQHLRVLARFPSRDRKGAVICGIRSQDAKTSLSKMDYILLRVDWAFYVREKLGCLTPLLSNNRRAREHASLQTCVR
jgi:hypothetical protein